MTDRVPEDLLEDLPPDDRAERQELLSWLLERGVEIEDLREAHREGRLALLPTEVVLTRDCRYSLARGLACRESGRTSREPTAA